MTSARLPPAVEVLERRYSAAEFSSLTGIPPATLNFFLQEGILFPSIQRATGRGRGHVFDVADVVSGRTMQELRLPNAAAPPLAHLVAFWHSRAGRALLRETASEQGTAGKARLLVVTNKGVEVDVEPRLVLAEHGATVAFCIDVRKIITDLLVMKGESQMLREFLEPRASGRQPEKGPRKRAIAQAKAGERGRRKK